VVTQQIIEGIERDSDKDTILSEVACDFYLKLICK
jgi:hypothetical protein